MEDLPGNYIEIDQEMFARSPSNIQVCAGKIIKITWQTTAKLAPTDTGTPCAPTDVSIVVSETNNHQKWSKLSHGYKSN
jgi:hypothetical protein